MLIRPHEGTGLGWVAAAQSRGLQASTPAPAAHQLWGADHRVPEELGQESQASSCVEEWNSTCLSFTALDLASITSHIHNWVLFLLWFHPFIISGVISPLICSILGTHRPGEFLFQKPLCDPMDGSPPGSPIPGILQARTLECAELELRRSGSSLGPSQ